MAESMPLDALSGGVALADLGLKAVKLFRKVEETLKESADEAWPEDLFAAELERFELWAANMGLFVAGHGSLDYRVREADRLAETLQRFMQDLINSLEDVFQMRSDAGEEGASGMDNVRTSGDLSATQAKGDEDEDEKALDMDLLLDSIRDPINRLFKMSTKIRNPSARLGSSRAANCRQVDEETGVDFLQVIKEADVDYVKSVLLEFHKAKARQENQPAEAPRGPSGDNDDGVWEPIRTVLIQEQEREKTGANSYLIERIAQANVRRRQQFAYWARHREKLDKHAKAYQAQKEQPPIAERQQVAEFPSWMTLNSGDVPSVTTATRLDIAGLETPDDRSNWTLSEYAPSTAQTDHAPVEFPPTPKIPSKNQKNKFFECPYCFFLCPKEMLAEKAWKAHLIHDLRPYICTYEDCRNPTQLYDSRQDWLQHENSEHRKVWRCLEHSNQVFKRLEKYKRHLQEEHAGSISGEAALIRIIQASESVPHIVDRACPICMVNLGTSRAMEGHIALHLERFARFSFPRSNLNDDDGSNADSGKANRVDEEGSRDNDFEGSFELHSDIDAIETQVTEHLPGVGSSGQLHGVGSAEDIHPAFQAVDNDDGISRESDRARHQVQESIDDRASSDNFKVGEPLSDLGKHKEVEKRYREALEQTEKTLGSEHPDTLASMASLARLLLDELKYEDAEKMHWRLRELREKVLGCEHLDTLAGMSELGFLLYKQGKYIESEQIVRETLELRKKTLGCEHPETLNSMANLAITLSALGRLEEVEELGVEAMETRKQVLGPAHPDTLTSMANLAITLSGLGRFEEAEKLFVEVMETRKQKLGSAHPETLHSMGELALTWYSQGRIADAIALMDSCVQMRCKVLGLEHPDTASAIQSLKALRAERGKQQYPAELGSIRDVRSDVDTPAKMVIS